jgi:uncharacterized protein (DUF3084 family)
MVSTECPGPGDRFLTPRPYSMTRNREAILRLFRVSHNRSAAFDPVAAIVPRQIAPIIRRATNGERELVMMT